MREKKGQVTIFIIFAIVITIGTIVYFSMQNGSDEIQEKVIPEISGINSFVEDCIKGTGNDAIYQISKNGGYHLPTQFSTETGIPYYYYDGENFMPSKNDIEEELSNYMNDNLDYCTYEFVDFPRFDIISGEVTSRVIIGENRISFEVNYPLTISSEGKTFTVEKFEDVNILVKFGLIYNSVDEIISEQLGRDDICLNCIVDVVTENNLTINIIQDEEDTIFTVKDENSKINGVSLKWNFANKY